MSRNVHRIWAEIDREISVVFADERNTFSRKTKIYLFATKEKIIRV